MAYAESIPCGERKQLQFWRASKVMDLDVLLVTLLANGFFLEKHIYRKCGLARLYEQ